MRLAVIARTTLYTGCLAADGPALKTFQVNYDDLIRLTGARYSCRRSLLASILVLYSLSIFVLLIPMELDNYLSHLGTSH